MSTAEIQNTPIPGFWRTVWGFLRHPRRTFEAQRERPSRAWWWMAALALIAVLLPVLTSAPISARIAREAMQKNIETIREQNPGITPEQETQMLNISANPLFTTVLPGVAAVIGAVLGWLVWSGALHLFSTMMGGGETFGQMWRVVVWSQLPLALRGLLQSIYIAATGQLIANPGLSGLVSQSASVDESVQQFMSAPPSTGRMVLQAFLGKIDLFLLWNLALLAIGVSVTARLSGRKAALLIIMVWLALTALALVPVLLSGSIAARTAF